MADRIVYVDGVGAGADEYATLNAAFAGEDGLDCTATGISGNLIIECENIEDTTAVTYTSGAGITTNATYGVIIRAADNHNGKWSTSAYRLVISSGLYGIRIAQDLIEHLTFRGLQIRHTTGSSNFASCINGTGSPTASVWNIEKCIIVGEDTASSSRRCLRLEEPNATYNIWNTVVYTAGANSSSIGMQIVDSGADVFIYNCTIDDVATGLDLSATGGTVVLKNTRITNVTTVADNSLNSASDYNLTDGTAPTNWGTNSIDGTDTPTIAYVDDTNATLTARDYHLDTGDDGIGAGTDLSSDTDLSFTDDIDGDTRG